MTKEFIKIPTTEIIEEIDREIELTLSVMQKCDNDNHKGKYQKKIRCFEGAKAYILGQSLPLGLQLSVVADAIRRELQMRLPIYQVYIQKEEMTRDECNYHYSRLRAVLPIVDRKHVMVLYQGSELLKKGLLDCCTKFSKNILYVCDDYSTDNSQLLKRQIEEDTDLIIWKNATSGHFFLNQIRKYAHTLQLERQCNTPILIVTSDLPLLETHLKFDNRITIYNLNTMKVNVILSKIKLNYPELFYYAE